ncbi:SIS domain-containing protein [Janthinobacterium kumbetense]|uniref:Phosphoheptose isomerase n=1 Tax=Janthinobacterium kumbetense TaxID=2950280 RepID=A0ABT0WTM4_9BURK|nr:SIS domain-containing protein [Janthinobacterium kumbetense]MCM2566643.1 SIS domain-containing protein [Janthinobacterium kumbetense]
MSIALIRNSLLEAQSALSDLLNNEVVLANVDLAANLIVESLRNDGKVLSCGNGGSMCDAIHFAEELSGRYRKNRKALAAMSISDPAHITCVANDYGYDYVFSRFIEGHGRKGDVVLAISTSGTSPSILNAVKAAQDKGMIVVGLTGRAGSALDVMADVSICTKAGQFADRVQELHIKMLHIIIELIEEKLGLS